jgi:methyl-accepting chemotaxis protein
MTSLKSGRLIALVCGSILGLAALGATGVYQFSAFKYQAAFNDYRANFNADGSAAQARLNDMFKLVYQNIRTISLLPSVKNIDRHAKQLSDNDREAIRRIYENANSNVQVSEIYVVPASFNPQAIDPETGKPEAPIASFDSEIANVPDQTGSTTEATNKAPQVEDEEYKLLTEQIAFLKQQYPDNKKIDGLNVPLISGHEVITCDNTEFDNTHNDADRKGIVLSVPFFSQDGKLAGVIAAMVRTNVLRQFLPDANAALTSAAYGFTVLSKTPGQAALSAQSVSDAKPDPKIKTSEVLKIETADANAGWVLWSGRPDSEFETLPGVENISNTERMGYGIVAGFAAIAMLGFLYVLKRYYEPTQRLTQSMLSLASGNLSVDTPHYARADIIGQISQAVRAFGENLRILKSVEITREQVISELGRGLSRIQSGDLSCRIDRPFPKEMDGLLLAFNEAVERLQSAISIVKSGADNIKNGSQQIASASDALAKRTESQAANIEETAAAVSEITSKVKEAASGASQARDAVALAKQDATSCEGIVNETIGAMNGIDQSSREITQIIGLMDEIAFQTNLLALNAGVEAARAGDVGRGFAVVAQEVRALAQRSTDAAKRIKDLIATSRGHVELGVKLVGQAGTSLIRIVDRVTEIDKVVGKIAASAQQQASALQEINAAVSQMDQMTQQNAAMVEKSNSETRSLVEKSDDLNITVGSFITAEAPLAA